MEQSFTNKEFSEPLVVWDRWWEEHWGDSIRKIKSKPTEIEEKTEQAVRIIQIAYRKYKAIQVHQLRLKEKDGRNVQKFEQKEDMNT